MSDAKPLTYDVLKQSVAGAAAWRCRRTLQPAGGPGDKVFPPTYAGATYAVEKRRLPGRAEAVTCVVLDSVQSQANRMEEALQAAVDDGSIAMPMVVVDFNDAKLPDAVGRISSLQAPHRIADAILRDSEYQKTPFRASAVGKEIDKASAAFATPLLRLCPTALVFGMWDSTHPNRPFGLKIERAIVSEVVGINAEIIEKNHGLRRDPLNTSKSVGPLYMTSDGQMTLNAEMAERELLGGKDTGKRKLWGKSKGKIAFIKPPKVGESIAIPDAGKPSTANHGNVPFASDNGGVTVELAEQTTTLSLIALRRLRFPVDGATSKPEADVAARAVLAALGLCSAALAFGPGMDLRSRCVLFPDEGMEWELLATPGQTPTRYTLDPAAAIKLLNDAAAALKKAGLPWDVEPVMLTPSKQLVELVRKSQELAVTETAED